jgi:hypothetical protein
MTDRKQLFLPFHLYVAAEFVLVCARVPSAEVHCSSDLVR